MDLQQLKDEIPGFLKDVRLNINVLSDPGELTRSQLAVVNLACAYSLKNPSLLDALHNEFSPEIDDALLEGARTAAALMAMNNIYYRFVHLVSKPEYQTLPAKLRMNAIGKPGIDAVDFELASLAVSALNGCGMCIDAHVYALEKAGVNNIAIQQAVRIAAVLNSVAAVL
jgi:alkyl hydroperoxide reductase subunit D